MSTRTTILLTLAGAGLVAVAAALALVYGGLYDVSASRQHTQPVYSLLETAMRQSVRLRARDVQVPALDAPALVARGAGCFRDKCVQCHGAPGVAQGDIGKSMQPLPGPLVDARQRWLPRELYWVTRHGIKMSGMPAWEFRLADADLWALVAFMNRLPELSPQDFAAMTQPAVQAKAWAAAGASRVGATACGAAEPAVPRAGDIERGKQALYQYACNACHTIPGVTGSSPAVGPPLAGLAQRHTLAGKLVNTPENMVRWLRHTREVDPLTAMPEMELTEQDATDIAAYLATLH